MSTTKFELAMNGSARTWNNAVSLRSPDISGKATGRISLFFKSAQGLNVPMLYQYLHDAAQEDLIDTFILAFHIRDCRGGKGLRNLGRYSLVWLFINYPIEFMKVMHLIPYYGRWDDLLYFFPQVLELSDKKYVQDNYITNNISNDHMNKLRDNQNTIVSHYTNQLYDDKNKMNEGKPCSLAAKWSPTEKDSLDREYGVFTTLAKSMNISPQKLRKMFNTPLRAYLNVVERYMCENKWNHIDYNKVPGHAMKLLRKAFEKHDEHRFQQWKTNLSRTDENKTKVNAKTLHPHQIVRNFRTNNCGDDVLEAQWKVLVEEVKKLGTLRDTVIVCDTSGSMTALNHLPLDISVALGMIVSEVVEGPFHNNVLTFNTTPQFVKLTDGSAYDRWEQIRSIPWGGSTDLQKTFKLILNRGRDCGLTDKDMPKRLFIVSDMQFNSIDNSNLTNFEEIDKMYRESGYTRPHIVFWNVNGSSDDFPVTANEHGTVLVSGSSPSILKAIINNVSFSTNDIIRTTLDDCRYNLIKEALM